MKTLLLIFLTISAQGAELVEDFSSTTQFDSASSTAIWNLAKKRVQVPLVIDRDETDGIVSEDDSVDIGTGKDGDFEPSTQVSFDVNNGAIPNTIVLDTSRIYEFTNFTVANGVTIRAIGNQPLRIRVQGSCTINGRINVRGGNATNAVPGTACCGGTAGGAGGSASDGSPGFGVVALGGGEFGKLPDGGGGGGGHATSGAFGGGVGIGGGGGIGYGAANVYLDPLQGGSGGGGGAGNPGGGGAGGGGVIYLACGDDLLISGSGQFIAGGGTGGNSADGGGGGGAGGAVFLISGGTFTNNGDVNADGGGGGSGTLNRSGGQGANGKIRMVGRLATQHGTHSPPITQPEFGQVAFSTSKDYLVASKPYSVEKRSLFATPVVEDSQLAGSSITYDFSELATLTSTFSWRATLRATNPSTGPEIHGLTFDYTDPRTEFNFKLSGCASVHTNETSSTNIAATLAFLLYLLALPATFRLLRPFRLSHPKKQK